MCRMSKLKKPVRNPPFSLTRIFRPGPFRDLKFDKKPLLLDNMHRVREWWPWNFRLCAKQVTWKENLLFLRKACFVDSLGGDPTFWSGLRPKQRIGHNDRTSWHLNHDLTPGHYHRNIFKRGNYTENRDNFNSGHSLSSFWTLKPHFADSAKVYFGWKTSPRVMSMRPDGVFISKR